MQYKSKITLLGVEHGLAGYVPACNARATHLSRPLLVVNEPRRGSTKLIGIEGVVVRLRVRVRPIGPQDHQSKKRKRRAFLNDL